MFLLSLQCLVLFAVYIRVSRKLKAGTKQIFLGQNVFPLESLKPGNYRSSYSYMSDLLVTS